VDELGLLRFLLGAGFLLYASVLDLRTRRVPNNVWIAFGFLASLLFLADWLVLHRLGWIHLLIVAGLILLSYTLWYLHLLAGGADAKALMAISILLPIPIDWRWADIPLPPWSSPLPGALTVLSNSVLLFALAPLALLLYNLGRGSVSMPAMFLGYTMDLEAAADSFVWIIDRLDETGAKRQVLFPSRTSDEEYDANIQRLRAAGIRRVWVTPKIPFMIPLLLGYVAAFLLGDVLFKVVTSMALRLR
jgi:preflagellin peptidase FlaK